jgi:RHS repeat-associated protein
VRDYRYNAAERLTEIDDNGQAIGRYRYDPMGRRVYKETATETTWFIYADEGLIAELQADGTLKRGYGWKPQGLWGTDPLWLADKTGAGASDWSTHIYHNDHLWTPQRLTDSAGVVSWSGRSEAFGLTTAVISTVENPLRFPGQYFHQESGLHYNLLRDYDPSVSWYSQADPLGLDGGVNIYAYSLANPLRYIDPTGEKPILIPIIVCLRFTKFCREIARCLVNPTRCRRRVCNAFNSVSHLVCDSVRSCNGETDSCFTLRRKKSQFQTCLLLRSAVGVCHGRKNDPRPAGHHQANDQVRKRIAKCDSLMQRKCC